MNSINAPRLFGISLQPSCPYGSLSARPSSKESIGFNQLMSAAVCIAITFWCATFAWEATTSSNVLMSRIRIKADNAPTVGVVSGTKSRAVTSLVVLSAVARAGEH